LMADAQVDSSAQDGRRSSTDTNATSAAERHHHHHEHAGQHHHAPSMLVVTRTDHVTEGRRRDTGSAWRFRFGNVEVHYLPGEDEDIKQATTTPPPQTPVESTTAAANASGPVNVQVFVTGRARATTSSGSLIWESEFPHEIIQAFLLTASGVDDA